MSPEQMEEALVFFMAAIRNIECPKCKDILIFKADPSLYELVKHCTPTTKITIISKCSTCETKTTMSSIVQDMLEWGALE